MRVLPLLVAVESLAVVVLGLRWLSDDGARPLAGAAGPVAADLPGPAAARSAALDRDRSPPADAAAETPRRPAADPGFDAAAGVVVRGRVTTTDGSPFPEDYGVTFRRGRTYRIGTTVGDRYAAAALDPGTWTVYASADAFVVLEFDHDVGTAAVQTLDLALEPAHAVAVYVTTPTGAGLLQSAVVGELGLHWGLHVIATEDPLAGDLPPTDNASVGDLGLGRFRSGRGLWGNAGPDDPDGVLWLDRPPPANAALLLRHVVLAQLPIAAGQRELRFVLEPDALRAVFGTLKVRLVDGTTGEGIGGLRVRASTAQGGGQSATTDGDGRAVVEHVMPGLAALEIRSGAGREDVDDLIRVPTRGTVDLGELVLHPTVELRGRVVDGGRPPAQAWVQWTDLATMDSPRELFDHRSARVDADGEFRLRVGPRRFVVIAGDMDGRRGHAVVDARHSAPEPVEIALRPAAHVEVRAPDGTLDAFVAMLRDADGVPVAARRIEPRFPQQTLSAAAGTYTLEVHGSGDRLAKRETVELRAGQTLPVEVR